MESSKVIDNQMKRLGKLQETIAHLKSRIAGNSRDFDDRNK